MLRAWKLLRVFWAMSTRTPYVNLRAWRLSRDEEIRYRAHRIQVGCSLLCDILGVSVHVRGSVPSRGGMLVVSNHFGILDPLILSSVLPSAPVGKAEVLAWPFLGWVSAAHGMIPVERRRRSTVSQFTERVRKRLDAGVNVVVFPEGTTTASLQVRRFKTGAFEAVAHRDGGAVLPVYLTVRSIDGRMADEAVRQRVVWADGGAPFVEHALDLASIPHMSFTVYLGRPIPTTGRDRKELAQLAREAVEALRLHGETIDT
ncbi:MAG: lysophospholipid acyltransferase family protein [Rhodothermales bacterium]